MKTNLPVLILKGIVLIPNSQIRIEFDNDSSKNIIDVSELFHDNRILVVSPTDPLEEALNINTLPKVGVVATFSNKMILPNGKVRIVITGINRARIHEYLNHTDEVLEAIISENKIDSEPNEVIINKLLKEIESYIKTVPYATNSLLSQLKSTKSLDKITDLIVTSLSINLDRALEYLTTFDASKRSEMILEDIYKEKETFKIEKEIDTKVKKEIDSNQKEFILREKMKAIKEELGDGSHTNEIETLKSKIDSLDCPNNIKNRLNKEFKKYETLPQASPEISMTISYIEFLLEMPWNTKTEDNNDLKKAKEILDKNHYGLDKVKERIIEFLAVKKQTNKLSGQIICLIGPPGVGKTSLASSIASAISRNFVKISLGGVNDTAEIIGHRKTYVGAEPGRIIKEIKKAKSNNPLFLIDEIDKLSKSIQGDPASALLEVLDSEQNKHFMDNYLEEEFDLSDVLFILTANYIDNIPEALKDRLEIIELSGYTDLEKLSIAKTHLIPNLCEQNGLKKLNINDETILYIIRNYTRESGVRELKRKLDTIIRKIVTEKVIDDIDIKQVSLKLLEKYLGIAHIMPKIESKVGVVNGLAYTVYGGDTLSIEANYYEGSGKLTLTGSLGDVMKESAYIALSYLKANYKEFNIKYDDLIKNDIHIHVPEGAVPKDGPSAGIALATALLSAFNNKKIKSDLAMTGELTLRGSVLPIGGLKEKSIGAYRNNIKTIIIPYDNLKDVNDVPKEVRENINYITIRSYEEIVKYIYED